MADHPHLDRFERLDRLSRQLDTIFRIPGTNFRVGYDAIASIIPVVGDAATALPAAWIMLESYRMGLPKGKLMRQGVNVAADAVFGSIPLLGTLFDAGFKSNRRNVDILRKHLETLPGEAPAPDPAPDGRMIERG
ncbi:DUF4112 domain-containing protein [Paracoccus sediminicola]|uniref:DUF4112 domain-containing protein n=1 Tax=Paracoccus sediminicola TaxID=3017783 RepID=UPI0022F10BE2|nr:DUF4112 domain-containing protein [Paracoccus sediminicola]WBU55697.1 DUF4112 domain-containing protein [Paracoccus sediminicola]